MSENTPGKPLDPFLGQPRRTADAASGALSSEPEIDRPAHDTRKAWLRPATLKSARPIHHRILGTARLKERLPRSRTGSLTGPNRLDRSVAPDETCRPAFGPASGSRGTTSGQRLPDRQAWQGTGQGTSGQEPGSTPAFPQAPAIRTATETTRRPKGSGPAAKRTRCDEHHDVRAHREGDSPTESGRAALRRRPVERLESITAVSRQGAR